MPARLEGYSFLLLIPSPPRHQGICSIGATSSNPPLLSHQYQIVPLARPMGLDTRRGSAAPLESVYAPITLMTAAFTNSGLYCALDTISWSQFSPVHTVGWYLNRAIGPFMSNRLCVDLTSHHYSYLWRDSYQVLPILCTFPVEVY